MKPHDRGLARTGGASTGGANAGLAAALIVAALLTGSGKASTAPRYNEPSAAAAVRAVNEAALDADRSGPPMDNWARMRSAMIAPAAHAPEAGILGRIAAGPHTYTLDADFDEGVMVGVNHDEPNHDQLQLNRTPTTFPFIWIAASGRDTVIRVDTRTGDVLGEYLTRPEGRQGNPSRTTVDLDGSVWVGNRNEPAPGSIVRVGLVEAGGCVDRNGDGRINTSVDLRDVRDWPNRGGVDSNGGVSTAEDECITAYYRVPPGAVRTIAVDSVNNIWVGGLSDRIHAYVDTRTGTTLRRTSAGCGGYGGLIDPNGVLWSASGGADTLYLDPSDDPLRPVCLPTRGQTSYGLGVNADGYVWNSTFGGDTVIRHSPSGLWLGQFPTQGGGGDSGVAVTPADNHVWVANRSGASVTRLDVDGSVLDVIPVGNTPTGVAVDAAGKVWATNMGSNSASRIDPAHNRVDKTVDLGARASPYNYSDMTGMVSRGYTTRRGTWLVVYDAADSGTPWGMIHWSSDEPVGTAVTVRARAAEQPADLGGAVWQTVPNGAPMAPTSGRFLQVEAILTTDINQLSPILYDLTVVPGDAFRTPTSPPTPTETATPTPTSLPTPTPTPTATPTPAPVHLPLALREACPEFVLHADVALVLDASTSMLDVTASGTTKLDAARAAVDIFLATIDMPADRAALVAYNDTALLLQGLTGDRTLVSQALSRVDVAMRTRTDLALDKAGAELARGRPERPESRPVIVLLTDGLPNPVSADEVVRVAERVRAEGVTIYTVGLGTDVNDALLRDIAGSADGYYASPTGDDLARLYQRIAVRLRCPGATFWGRR